MTKNENQGAPVNGAQCRVLFCGFDATGSAPYLPKLAPRESLSLPDAFGVTPASIGGHWHCKNDVSLTSFQNKKRTDLANEINSGTISVKHPVLCSPSAIADRVSAARTERKSLKKPINQTRGCAYQYQGRPECAVTPVELGYAVNVHSAFTVNQTCEI